MPFDYLTNAKSPVHALRDHGAEVGKAQDTIKRLVGKDYYNLKTEQGRQNRVNKLSKYQKSQLKKAEATLRGSNGPKGAIGDHKRIGKVAKNYAKTANTQLKNAGVASQQANKINNLNAQIKAAQQADALNKLNARIGGNAVTNKIPQTQVGKLGTTKLPAGQMNPQATKLLNAGISAGRQAPSTLGWLGRGLGKLFGAASAPATTAEVGHSAGRNLPFGKRLGQRVFQNLNPREAARVRNAGGMTDLAPARQEVVNRQRALLARQQREQANGGTPGQVDARRIANKPPTPKQNANDVAAAAKVQSDNKLRQDQQRRVKNVKQQMAKQVQSTKKPPTQAIAKGQNQYNNTLKAQERFDNMYGPRGMTQGVPTAKERKPIDDQYDDRALTEALLRKISGK